MPYCQQLDVHMPLTWAVPTAANAVAAQAAAAKHPSARTKPCGAMRSVGDGSNAANAPRYGVKQAARCCMDKMPADRPV